LPKRASYDPTDAGVNIASNTLACFSARLGLLPQHVGHTPVGAEAVDQRLAPVLTGPAALLARDADYGERVRPNRERQGQRMKDLGPIYRTPKPI
jgi:hypothetical protein